MEKCIITQRVGSQEMLGIQPELFKIWGFRKRILIGDRFQVCVPALQMKQSSEIDEKDADPCKNRHGREGDTQPRKIFNLSIWIVIRNKYSVVGGCKKIFTQSEQSFRIGSVPDHVYFFFYLVPFFGELFQTFLICRIFERCQAVFSFTGGKLR